MFKNLALLFGFFCLTVTVQAHAETPSEVLDDASIKAFYAAGVPAMLSGDAEKVRQLIDAQADEKFSFKSTTTVLIGDQPPQTKVEEGDKAKMIADTMDGLKQMTIEKMDNAIKKISYSADKKLAYVEDSTTSSGKLSTPVQGQGTVTSKYDISSTCHDTLTLTAGKLKMLKSDCVEHFKLELPKMPAAVSHEGTI